MENTTKRVRYVCGVMIALTIIIFALSKVLSEVECDYTYKYQSGRIVPHSWHDIYEIALGIVFAAFTIGFIYSCVAMIRAKLKYKAKISKPLSLTAAVYFMSVLFVHISLISVVNIWTHETYDTEWYEFSDGKHTIVVEEESFLLYGGGTIYQIDSDNNAEAIAKIRTDDGGRNHGNYEIEWHEEYFLITYNTFSDPPSHSEVTKKVHFAYQN